MLGVVGCEAGCGFDRKVEMSIQVVVIVCVWLSEIWSVTVESQLKRWLGERGGHLIDIQGFIL